MKKALLSFLLLVCCLLSVMVFRAISYPVTPEPVEPIEGTGFQGQGHVERLAQSLTFPTISSRNDMDLQPFADFHTFLRLNFPLTHEQLQLEMINGHSQLFTWPGKDPSLKPVVLLAHQDVVPIVSNKWTHPPFEGVIEGGYIWGRGALDDKASLVGILEATENLLAQGFQPVRTLYFAFGHDEEIGGEDGAAFLAANLKEKGVDPEFVLDEGGTVINGQMQNLPGLIALIGISEKGYISLKLTAKGKGGHSSMPPPSTAVGIISHAITRLEDNLFPADLSFLTTFTSNLGPELPFFQRLILANSWLTKGLVVSSAEASNTTNAMIRTTTAATMMSGSIKDNVLPNEAWAVVNFRILPGQTVDDVEAYVSRIIDDERVVLSRYSHGSNPPPISPVNNKAYDLIRRTIHQAAGDQQITVAPYLTVGGTDSRHFTQLTPNVYRFLFNIMEDESDIARIHGVDERVSIENYNQTINFYYLLFKNLDRL